MTQETCSNVPTECTSDQQSISMGCMLTCAPTQLLYSPVPSAQATVPANAPHRVPIQCAACSRQVCLTTPVSMLLPYKCECSSSSERCALRWPCSCQGVDMAKIGDDRHRLFCKITDVLCVNCVQYTFPGFNSLPEVKCLRTTV